MHSLMINDFQTHYFINYRIFKAITTQRITRTSEIFILKYCVDRLPAPPYYPQQLQKQKNQQITRG